MTDIWRALGDPPVMESKKGSSTRPTQGVSYRWRQQNSALRVYAAQRSSGTAAREDSGRTWR